MSEPLKNDSVPGKWAPKSPASELRVRVQISVRVVVKVLVRLSGSVRFERSLVPF